VNQDMTIAYIKGMKEIIENLHVDEAISSHMQLYPVSN